MKYLLLVLFSNSLYAAGSGGIGDLAAPAVNFAIFIAILYFALRKPITSHFATHADNVAETYERAQVKKKEADAKYNEAETKMNNSDNDVEKIKQSAEEDIKRFEKEYAEEVTEKIEKYRVDSVARIKAEESTLFNNLNSKLVGMIVDKAKNQIKSDTGLKQKATEKLVKEVH